MTGLAARALAVRANSGIPVASIRLDGGTQSRAMLSDAVIEEYAAAIREGVEFPPITVFYDGADHWLADGFHRVRAFMSASVDHIPADVRQGTRRDAILYSVGANEAHGLRRTNDDKRRAVMTLLNDTEWSVWSDREIGRKCNVHHTFVGRLRSVTGADTSEQKRTYTTKHGTEATMNTSAIGKTAPGLSETNNKSAPPNTQARVGARVNVPEGQDLIALIRRGLAMEREGSVVDRVSEEIGLSRRVYRLGRTVVLLAENKNLSPVDAEIAQAALQVLAVEKQIGAAWEIAEPVALKVWGDGRIFDLMGAENKRLDKFELAFGIVLQSCLTTNEIDLPYLSADRVQKAVDQIAAARSALLRFAERIKEIHG